MSVSSNFLLLFSLFLFVVSTIPPNFPSIIVGIFLIFLARAISNWDIFYITISMALGIFLLPTLLIFQGWKFLQTCAKKVFYFIVCGSVVTLLVGRYSILPSFWELVKTIFFNFEVREQINNPVFVFLLVLVVLAGANSGFWIVNKYIISEVGFVNDGFAQFVEWTMRIAGCFVIFLNSHDAPLALATLLSCWAIYKLAFSLIRPGKMSSPQDKMSNSPKKPSASSNSSVKGPSSEVEAKNIHDFQYHWSTFHKIPHRKNISKKDWTHSTKKYTKESMTELAEDPKFQEWIVANYDQIEHRRPSSDETVGAEDEIGIFTFFKMLA